MSQDEQQEAFWQRTDEVIALANQQSENEESEAVSGSLLYASARFNAFIIAAQAAARAPCKVARSRRWSTSPSSTVNCWRKTSTTTLPTTTNTAPDQE